MLLFSLTFFRTQLTTKLPRSNDLFEGDVSATSIKYPVTPTRIIYPKLKPELVRGPRNSLTFTSYPFIDGSDEIEYVITPFIYDDYSNFKPFLPTHGSMTKPYFIQFFGKEELPDPTDLTVI